MSQMPMEASSELPFFEPRHRELAATFQGWVASRLTQFETNEGGDGQAAKEIYQILAKDGWLPATVMPVANETKKPIDLRGVCLMREVLGYSSAIADVAFSEPWLAALTGQARYRNS